MKKMNSQLHELLKAYLNSGNSVPRVLESDLNSIIAVFDRNSKETESYK